MKIVALNGGLGNQIFQYAFYLSLKSKGYKVYMDKTPLINYRKHGGVFIGDVFPVQIEIAPYNTVKSISLTRRNTLFTSILRKIFKQTSYEYYQNEGHFFLKEVFEFEDTKTCYFLGYWQNTYYFDSVFDLLKTKLFFDISKMNNLNIEVLQKIRSCFSISIHVRRGDFVREKQRLTFSNEYFMQAISYFRSRFPEPCFFVFSDDIDYCREIFPGRDFVFVDINSEYHLSYWDMCLMSYCKNNILSNSSFSFWSSFLNVNSNCISIAPKVWIRDIQTESFTSHFANWIYL